jgi:hypothetical protein
MKTTTSPAREPATAYAVRGALGGANIEHYLHAASALERDHMVREGVGRLAVVSREHPAQVVGVITRSDLLSGHRRRLRGLDHAERLFRPRVARRFR